MSVGRALARGGGEERRSHRRPPARTTRVQHQCFCCLAVLVILAEFFVPVESAHVATLPCGGTIPIDSQFMFDPIWSVSPFRNSIRQASEVDLRVSKESVARGMRNLIKSESGMEPNSVTIFRLAPTQSSEGSSGEATGESAGEGGSSSSSSSSNNGSDSHTTSAPCTISLDPLRVALDGIRSTGARLVFLGISDSANGGCPGQVIVNFTHANVTTSFTLSQTSSSGSSSQLTQSVSLGGGSSNDGDAITWPATLAFPSACQMEVLLLTNRHGRIDRWYAWIPTTVYTGVVTALIIPALFVNKHMPTGLIALEIILVFLGYLGACVGLIVELICWQSALGRMFPFPSSVTLYACLSVLYALYLLPLVFRSHGHNRVLLTGVLRLLVYGLNCALCVGYWISGYVLLGSLALFQYVATNTILTFYFAKTTVRLRNITLQQGPVKFAHVFTYLWFLPATPFAVCGLMYSDLYSITRFGETKRAEEARVRDVVCVYNAQMSIPLLFFQNIYGVALVAAATAFHMPFVVVLFAAVWLFSLHFVYSCDAYVGEYRRWRERGVANLSSFTCCGWIWLSPIMDFLLKKNKHNRNERPQESLVGQGDDYGPPGGGEIVHSGNNNNFTSPPRSADRFNASVGGMSDRRWRSSTHNPQQQQGPYSQRQHQNSGAYADGMHTNDDDNGMEDGGLLYFPPIPQPSAERRRDSWQDNTAGREPEGDSGDDVFHSEETATPTNQRAGDPTDPQFWPTSVER